MFTLVAASGVLLGDRVLLGSHIAVLTGVEPASSLPASDALLARGAAVTLVVPLPQSGLASSSTTTADAALRLLLRISRGGMSRLQTALDYANCDPRSLVAGNRPRLTYKTVRADDVEDLALTLLDSSALVVVPDMPLGSSGADDEEQARRAMRRGLLTETVKALRRRGLSGPLARDPDRVRWAWLDS